MAYMAFLRPMWSWLRGESLEGQLAENFLGITGEVPHRDGHATVATMRAHRSGVPWESMLQSWLLLDSHDTARFTALTGSVQRTMVGVGMQMTMPGVPMVWEGDEIGLGGLWGEDSRRGMPWNDTDSWNHDLLTWYKALILLRRSSDALAVGGLRYVAVESDVIVYLRETSSERILCAAIRANSDTVVRINRVLLGASSFTTLVGIDLYLSNGDCVDIPPGGPAFHAWRIS